VCLISFLVTFINVFVNYALSAALLSGLMLGVSVVVGFLFYNSRIKGHLNASIAVFGLLGNLFFILNFFYNSGLNGPSLLIFLLFFMLIINITPVKYYGFWVVQNIVTVTVLLSVEYYHPGWVPNNYRSPTERFIDFGYSYMAITSLIFMVTLYIRTSYYRQQAALKKEAAELEIANATKNKLLSVVAHDLRAPLGSIQNYLEILTDYRLDEEEKKTIEQDLLEKTKNTADMLSNLLSWTMNQMKGVSVNLKQVNLKSSLRAVVKLQQALARDKGIVLLDLIDDRACVIADSNMLQLVVRNLLNNSIKFTPPGGEVTLATESRHNDCCLIIRDNGIGIPGDMRDDIFSLKTRSTYGTKNEKGAGLGLVLCKEFTELQHGRIWFESLTGKGTAFYISLPGCGKQGDEFPAPAAGNAHPDKNYLPS